MRTKKGACGVLVEKLSCGDTRQYDQDKGNSRLCMQIHASSAAADSGTGIGYSTLMSSLPVVLRLAMSFWDSATPSAVKGYTL